MSLLDRGRETVILFPEEIFTDEDGNVRGRPSATGVPVYGCVVQVQNQSGTSSRRQEQQQEGFESERIYRVRFPRSFTGVIGAQSQVEWRGQRWSVFGDVKLYNGSAATAHRDFSIRRA